MEDYQYMFIWESGHAVFFGRGGEMKGVSRWVGGGWKDASADFDTDRESRAITFKKG